MLKRPYSLLVRQTPVRNVGRIEYKAPFFMYAKPPNPAPNRRVRLSKRLRQNTRRVYQLWRLQRYLMGKGQEFYPPDRFTLLRQEQLTFRRARGAVGPLYWWRKNTQYHWGKFYRAERILRKRIRLYPRTMRWTPRHRLHRTILKKFLYLKRWLLKLDRYSSRLFKLRRIDLPGGRTAVRLVRSVNGLCKTRRLKVYLRNRERYYLNRLYGGSFWSYRRSEYYYSAGSAFGFSPLDEHHQYGKHPNLPLNEKFLKTNTFWRRKLLRQSKLVRRNRRFISTPLLHGLLPNPPAHLDYFKKTFLWNDRPFGVGYRLLRQSRVWYHAKNVPSYVPPLKPWQRIQQTRAISRRVARPLRRRPILLSYRSNRLIRRTDRIVNKRFPDVVMLQKRLRALSTSTTKVSLIITSSRSNFFLTLYDPISCRVLKTFNAGSLQITLAKKKRAIRTLIRLMHTVVEYVRSLRLTRIQSITYKYSGVARRVKFSKYLARQIKKKLKLYKMRVKRWVFYPLHAHSRGLRLPKQRRK